MSSCYSHSVVSSFPADLNFIASLKVPQTRESRRKGIHFSHRSRIGSTTTIQNTRWVLSREHPKNKSRLHSKSLKSLFILLRISFCDLLGSSKSRQPQSCRTSMHSFARCCVRSNLTTFRDSSFVSYCHFTKEVCLVQVVQVKHVKRCSLKAHKTSQSTREEWDVAVVWICGNWKRRESQIATHKSNGLTLLCVNISSYHVYN